uniref:KIAA1549 like n=1 Tax=Vombatus ursinus TaxID=29139 RepID=A0A4X2L405_VOMUR
ALLSIVFPCTNHLQMNVTLTPQSFTNPRRSTSTSPTWPSWELKSSLNVDRLKDPMRHFPENASLLQIIKSTLAHPPPRTRAQTDFSSALYQGSGHSASLDPPKELAQALTHPRPRDSDEAADLSGLPQPNMSVPLSTTPSVTLSSAVLSSQPVPLGTPSIPNQHTSGSDIVSALPSPSLSSSVAGSPHTIIFSKPTELPDKVPSFPQTVPLDSSHRESTDNPLDLLSSKTSHPPSRKAQELTDILSLDFSGSTTTQYSRLAPSERLHPESPSTSVFVNSMPDIPHLSSPPVAPGSLPWLPSQTPTLLKFTDMSSSGPVRTQPFKSRVTKRAHGSVSWPAFESSSEMPEVGSRLVQSTDREAASMKRRHSQPAPATVNKPVHLLPAPEDVKARSHSAKHAPSSLVPATWSFASAGEAAAAHATSSPAMKNEPASFSTPEFPRPSQSKESPLLTVAKNPTSKEKNEDGTPADLLLTETGQSSGYYSTTASLPLGKEGSMMSAFMGNEKANMVISPSAVPTQETTSQSTLSEATSDLTTDHIPAAVLTERGTNLTLSELPVPPIPPTEGSSASLKSSPIADAESEVRMTPANTSKVTTLVPKQEAANPLHSSIPARTQELTRTIGSQTFLPEETESRFLESAIPVLSHQKGSDLNGHEKSPVPSVTHSPKITAPNGSNLAAKMTRSPEVRGSDLQLTFAKGLSVQYPSLNPSTEQAMEQATHQARVTAIGNSTDFWPTGHKNITWDLETSFSPPLALREAFTTADQHLLPSPPSESPPLFTSLPPASSDVTPPISLQEMLSGETETRTLFASTRHPLPTRSTSVSFQSARKSWTFPATVLPTLTHALFKTTPKVPLTSPVPENWTVATAHAGSLVPGSQHTGMTTSTAKASSISTSLSRKYTLSALSAALVSKGTENKISVPSPMVAKSTLTPVLAKNGTPSGTPGSQMAASTTKAIDTPTASPFVSTTHRTTQANMITAAARLSTTHFPGKSQAMQSDYHKAANSEMPRISTTFPLTIMAALTSITTSGKATKLPPLPVENTSAALPVASTTVVTTGKTTLNLECQMSRKLTVKTVLFLTQRRLQINDSLRPDVAKGLTQALQKAFRQNDIYAHVEILDHSHNVTVGYYVTKGKLVYIPAVVVENLVAYGISNVTADLKQHVPNLQSVAVLALPWNPQPAYAFQLKTVLQFVGQSDNIQSCKFVQTMEQRLQKAFQDAEKKVLSTTSNLTVEILNTSNASQAVTLTYAVWNQSTLLNGTVSSSLLSQLSAELVGFYLTYPPLTIAESLEYPNLDVSETTRDYWVITVLQGVDNTLVGLHNQSFARVMEQRLAQLFMMSQQQGRRLKRATTLGSYTVQMVKMQRVPGPKDPAELTYYTLHNGKPLLGTAAAKILSTIDSQRMALTLHHVVLLQADPVVKNPPNNLWIIAAVLAPIAVVTVIIIIITAVLCRKNKNDFKPDTMVNLPQRAKPVQGFDYAKQHLGQQGAEEEVIPVTQETVVLPLPVRDAPASQEREIAQDGSTIKTAQSTETRKSRSPSENGSVLSSESGKPSPGRPSSQNVTATATAQQQKVTKEEGRKRNVPVSDEEEGAGLFDSTGKPVADPFDTSSGSVQLIAIKPAVLAPAHPASERSQESAIINGEVNKALKQKSDIEHYRNKLRLKAKRKGYYDFPQVEGNKALTERKMYEKAPKDIDHVLDTEPEVPSPFGEPKSRQQMKNSVYRSRQSLNSPSPGETEMDLLVTRERPRRGIRNSGYDTEPEIIEETNIDRVNEPRGYPRSRQVKGHSETSTLSSQPSIDEVRQQMHMLLEEAFSLASAGHSGQNRQQDTYGSAQHFPYSEVVTSAPGTMTRSRGGMQWVPTYRPEMYQYSLPRPAYRFSQLPEMVMGSPPPPVPPRTGPVAVASLRRSTSDIGSKTRMSESSGPEPAQLHDSTPFAQVSRGPVSVSPLDQSALNYSGSTVPAVFAIPAANRPGFTGYFIPTPPSSYRNQAWMSYAGENELPGQWADSVPLPGYIEAYPRSRYQQTSPSRLPRQYSQPTNMHPSLEQAPLASTAASQQSLAENDTSDTPLTNISTAALVKAIREEVAKLAKKQTDMFEFQV